MGVYFLLMRNHPQVGDPGLAWRLRGPQWPGLLYFVAPPFSTYDLVAQNSLVNGIAEDLNSGMWTSRRNMLLHK